MPNPLHLSATNTTYHLIKIKKLREVSQLDCPSGSNHAGEDPNSKSSGLPNNFSFGSNAGLGFEDEKPDEVSVPTRDHPCTNLSTPTPAEFIPDLGQELEFLSTSSQTINPTRDRSSLTPGPDLVLIPGLVPESHLPSHQPEKLATVDSFHSLSPSIDFPPYMFPSLQYFLHDNLHGTEEGCSFGDGRQLVVSEDPRSVNFSQQLLRSVPGENEEEEKRRAMVIGNHLSAQPSTQGKENYVEELEDEGTEQCESPAPATLNEDQAPTKGMEFSSKDEAYEFYKSFAENKGFNVRKGRTQWTSNGTLRKQIFFCSSEGYRREKKDGITTRKKRKETRTGCKAQIQIALENGKWVVVKLCLEHNHAFDLSPKKSKTVKKIGSKGLGSQKAEDQKSIGLLKRKRSALREQVLSSAPVDPGITLTPRQTPSPTLSPSSLSSLSPELSPIKATIASPTLPLVSSPAKLLSPSPFSSRPPSSSPIKPTSLSPSTSKSSPSSGPSTQIPSIEAILSEDWLSDAEEIPPKPVIEDNEIIQAQLVIKRALSQTLPFFLDTAAFDSFAKACNLLVSAPEVSIAAKTFLATLPSSLQNAAINAYTAQTSLSEFELLESNNKAVLNQLKEHNKKQQSTSSSKRQLLQSKQDISNQIEELQAQLVVVDNKLSSIDQELLSLAQGREGLVTSAVNSKANLKRSIAAKSEAQDAITFCEQVLNRARGDSRQFL